MDYPLVQMVGQLPPADKYGFLGEVGIRHPACRNYLFPTWGLPITHLHSAHRGMKLDLANAARDLRVVEPTLLAPLGPADMVKWIQPL